MMSHEFPRREVSSRNIKSFLYFVLFCFVFTKTCTLALIHILNLDVTHIFLPYTDVLKYINLKWQFHENIQYICLNICALDKTLQIVLHQLYPILNILGELFFSKISVKNSVLNYRNMSYILHFNIFQYLEFTWLGTIYIETPALALW